MIEYATKDERNTIDALERRRHEHKALVAADSAELRKIWTRLAKRRDKHERA
jgi:hypothetical protein